ncbi:hypothetical protein J2S43_004946 [Catenuloplanes nepalensis]|uniref:Knr4/Smi1-like domain-containing protein n=1 Tax=Catenuloplanes nepalensis TaxID=587533 RepID=A0ABT9MYB8_9ACTN|nr:hypothetical protein [Catenuloplanes nepalensis]MDP9796434.1 hypothetical protein [Catenuloplanes nepalensis]
MSENILALRQAVGWEGAESAVDWRILETEIGIPFPREYRALVDAFPPGEFQTFLKVLHPAAFAGAAEFRREIAGYAAIVADWAREQPGTHRVYPTGDGLIPWAIVGFDYVLCWQPGAGHPDTWPTIICSSGREPWPVVNLPTAAAVAAVVTVPPVIEVLAYIAEEVQPPEFTPLDGFEPAPEEGVSKPDGHYWIEQLQPYTPRILESVSARTLAPLVQAVAVRGFSPNKLFTRARQMLPSDYRNIVATLGVVTVGPARLCVPDGSDHDFFAVGEALSKRVAAERKRGEGPHGTIHPESDGLMPWGRLDGGGYLGWARISGDSYEWPVVALDASLRHHVAYPMSVSRFLYELATNPDGVVLPPA